MADWRDPGNTPIVDEYLRRQAMSAGDYADFQASLKRDFPGEPFLIVRYGDHQPDFAATSLEPGLTDAEIAQRLIAFDPRYFSTYYAIDTINFDAANLSSALDKLDAPYLPLVVQEAAGLPLDPTFTEQRKILDAVAACSMAAPPAPSAALQSNADRCRPDQAAVTDKTAVDQGDAVPLACTWHLGAEQAWVRKATAERLRATAPLCRWPP